MKKEQIERKKIEKKLRSDIKGKTWRTKRSTVAEERRRSEKKR